MLKKCESSLSTKSHFMYAKEKKETHQYFSYEEKFKNKSKIILYINN